MPAGPGEVIIDERVISEEPLDAAAADAGTPTLNGPSPMRPATVEQIPAPEIPSVIEQTPPGAGNSVPAPPQPRSGNRVIPQDKRLTNQPVSPNGTRAATVVPASAARTAQRPMSPGVKPADFKFIDEQTAASMSGIAR